MLTVETVNEIINRIPNKEQLDPNAETYFQHILELKPKTKITVFVRESYCKGLSKLDTQIEFIKIAAKILDLEVELVVISYTGSGYGDSWFSFLKSKIGEIVESGSVPVFLDTSRAIRNPMVYWKHSASPTIRDLEKLKTACGDTKPVTAIHPGFSTKELISMRIVIGQKKSGSHCGRVAKKFYHKETREEYVEYAWELYKQGTTIREIARLVSEKSGKPITHPGILKWLNYYRKVVLKKKN